jgi:hypothetical protein
MAHFLDPKNDLTFKRVFGEHKHLCISLLNSMLPFKKPIISKVIVNSIRAGYSVETISTITGLTPEEIKKKIIIIPN